MNTMSASPAETTGLAGESAAREVLVWDLPVRVFHWLMALSFAGAWLTAESERWQLVHVTLGYTMAGLVAFRVVWGLIGSRPARFSSFVRGPVAAWRYLLAAVRGRPEHHTGHNPAGALAIVGLLLLAIGVTATGWANYNDLGGHWLEEVHEVAASAMLALVGVHLAGVAFGSWLHKENLPRAMVTGRKSGRADEAAGGRRRAVGVLLLAAVLGFWAFQWSTGPSTDAGGPAAVSGHDRHGHDEDDD